jgi:hypothetical protein
VRDADLLTGCLADLDRRGWDLDSFLVERAELPPSVRVSLLAARRVRLLAGPVPSAEFRARSRARLVTFIQQEAVCSRRRSPIQRLRDALSPVLGRVVAPAAAALVLLFGTAGAWRASADALPTSPLYPAKLAFERLELFAALTPEQDASAHLDVAGARLAEATAELHQGNSVEAASLVRDYDREVAGALVALQAGGESPTSVGPSFADKLASLEERRATLWGQLASDSASRPVRRPTSQPAGQVQPLSLVSPLPKAAVPTVAPAATATVSTASTVEPRDDALGGVPLERPRRATRAPAGPQVTSRPPATASTPAPILRQVSPIDRWLDQLLSQAQAGNATQAFTSAQDLVAALNQVNPQGAGAATWQSVRARLRSAEATAPAATQPILQMVVTVIDETLSPDQANAPVTPSQVSNPAPIAISGTLPTQPGSAVGPAPKAPNPPTRSAPSGNPSASPNQGNPVVGQPSVPIVAGPKSPNVLSSGPVLFHGKPISMGTGTTLAPPPPAGSPASPPSTPPASGTKGKRPTK